MDSREAIIRTFFEAAFTPVIQNRISRRKFRSTFLNGKQIEVEYNYDWRKRGNERLKINIQGLLPIFGGIKLPIRRKFVTLSDVEAVLKIRRGLHLCEDGIYTPCSNLDAELQVEENTCPFNHFHHHCPKHVNAWFEWYLHRAIVLQEKDYTGLMKFDNLVSITRQSEDCQNIDNPEFWLRVAQQNGCGCSRKMSPNQQASLSTNIFPATFLNGKHIEVDYNYDQTRPREERVQIRTQSLLPVFGGTMLSDGRPFVSVPDVEDVLKSSPGLHKCKDGIYTPCSNLDAELQVEEDTCPSQHFHHYCPEHVNAWFKWYLPKAIALREGDYDVLVKNEDSQNPDRMMTGDRFTPEFWLHFAQQNGCGCSRKISPKQERPLSTNIFPATFLNGKLIEVEYNYDRTRPREERVQISIQGLLPVFGGIMPPAGRPFVSVFDVEDVLKSSPGLHQCGDGIYTPCSNLDAELQVEEDTCPFQHFHHYCPLHVNAWFKWYLPKAIALREEDYDVLSKNEDSQNPDRKMTGSRLDPECWLHFAQQNGCGCSRKISPKQPAQLSTNIFAATFLNGKQIDVEYNYDRTRPREERVQISIQGLLPVFGGIMPPAGRPFVSVFDVEDVLKSSPGLHQCGDGIYTPCSNLDAELQVEEDTCPFQHFHHYCPDHVNAWFKWYLPRVIALREGDFPELPTLEDSQYNVRMMTSDRLVPEFWLSFAQQHGCGCFRKISPKRLRGVQLRGGGLFRGQP